MNILLTYDLKKSSENIHQKLKERLIETYGYSATIKASNGRTYALPNTTLIKTNSTLLQVGTDFIKACSEVDAYWEKYLNVEFKDARFDNQ